LIEELIQELNQDFRTLIGRPQISGADVDTPIPVNLIAAFLIGGPLRPLRLSSPQRQEDNHEDKTRARVSP